MVSMNNVWSLKLQVKITSKQYFSGNSMFKVVFIFVGQSLRVEEAFICIFLERKLKIIVQKLKKVYKNEVKI